MVGQAHGERAGEPLRAELHAKGYRLTAQRQLVLEAVAKAGHGTPEQLLALVRARAAGVNISTVYRALALLEELGLVRHAHLGRAPAYSLTAEDAHVHVSCRDCGQVLELPGIELAQLAARLVERDGFVLDVGHTALTGRCAACSSRRAAAQPH